MKGSFRIAQFFGIPVRIHWTFLLIFVYVFYVGFQQEWDTISLLWSLSFVLALFTCVVMHEFGHALTARRYGVGTQDIILSPIGGVARLDKLPEKPGQEFMVAIAGPLVNVAIAIVLSPYFLTIPANNRKGLLLSILNPSSNFFSPVLTPFDYFLVGLIALNLMLAVFNMLPAFPMDGGRVLRAALSTRMSRRRATRIASRVGQFFAVLLLLYGIFIEFNIVYVFIGLFVFITAANEYRMVRLESIMRSHKVKGLMQVQMERLYPDDSIEAAIAMVGRGQQKDFFVFDKWQNLIGLLSEKEVINAFRKKDFSATVADYMKQDVPTVLDDCDLETAFAAYGKQQEKLLAVYNAFGVFKGMLHWDQLNDFMNLHLKSSKFRFFG